MIAVRFREKVSKYPEEDLLELLEGKKFPQSAEYFDEKNDAWKPVYLYLEELERVAENHAIDAMPGIVVAVLFLVMLNLFFAIFQFNFFSIFLQVLFIVGFFKRVIVIYWMCRGLMLLSAIIVSFSFFGSLGKTGLLSLYFLFIIGIFSFQFFALGTRPAKRYFKVKKKAA